MTEKQKTRWVFLLTLILAGGVYAWFYPLNKGIIRVTVNVPNFGLRVGDVGATCPGSPCDIKVKTGGQRLTVLKSGYVEIGRNTLVQRGKVTEETVELLKQVELKVSSLLPKGPTPPRQAPNGTEPETWQTHAWNEDGKVLVYLNKESGRLFKWTEAELSPVTTLRTEKPLAFYLSPTAEKLVIQEENALYFVDTLQATRQKIALAWEPTAITWLSKGDAILINDENANLFKIEWDQREPINTEKVIPLSNAVWATEGTLVYYQTDENKKTTISLYEVISDFERTLIERSDFPVTRMVLESDSRKILLLNPEEKAWYELEY